VAGIRTQEGAMGEHLFPRGGSSERSERWNRKVSRRSDSDDGF